MKRLVAVLVLAAAAWGPHARAGEAGEALSKCLTTSATQDDRRVLAQWIFAAISSHPDLETLTSISAEQRTELEKEAAVIFERLIAVDCTPLAREVIVREGSEGFANAFRTLGGLAMGGIVEDEKVKVGMARLSGSIDEQRILKALLTQ
jgi:hypothetical protein